MENINETLAAYDFTESEEGMRVVLDGVIEKKLKQDYRSENILQCVECMDYTTLKLEDTEEGIGEFIAGLGKKTKRIGSLPASVCVYPIFAGTVHKLLEGTGIATCSVAAGFPVGQTFMEVKLQECRMAIEKGAEEIDVVISVAKIKSGDFQGAFDDLLKIREVCRDVTLKVILEVGELSDYQMIHKAALVAMYAGADFVKTSTGKVTVNATPEAVFVICDAIKQYFSKTGKKVGVKVAGGVSTAVSAIKYRTIVSFVLGEDWMNPGLFRIGTSRLLDNILETLPVKK